MSALPVAASPDDRPDDSLRLHLSFKQEALLDALLGQYARDRFVLVPGYAIRPLLASNRLAVLRVKLRRVGWDIISHSGKGGGYRLAKLPPKENAP